jgi:hypothetical protein
MCQAQPSLGQILHIYTHFSNTVAPATWLLEIRENETGRVLPYIYEIHNNENFWIAFTSGRTYRITASTVKFGPYAQIRNFCHLENGIIDGKSMWITLSGELSPDTRRFKCIVSQFKDMPFQYKQQS